MPALLPHSAPRRGPGRVALMRVVALTGSVAAGKSTVDALFREWGAAVIDADALVRAMQRRGEPVFDAMVGAFGPSMLAPDGELDRARLRRMILDDPARRRQLEAIVHPAVDVRAQGAGRGGPRARRSARRGRHSAALRSRRPGWLTTASLSSTRQPTVRRHRLMRESRTPARRGRRADRLPAPLGNQTRRAQRG